MIRKFALEHSEVFENLELNFKNGFYVFSGPSGSGKSVLMESLLSSFGLREPNAANIETDLILNERFLEELGLEGENLNIKIVKKDKIRYFVNFAPIAKKHLTEALGEYVKHIHSRGGDELMGEKILEVLDSMIAKQNPNYTQSLADFGAKFAEYKALKSKINELSAKESEIASLKEMLEFEINKIKDVNPKVGEYEELLEAKKMLSRKEKIQDAITKANIAFESTSDIIAALNQIGANPNPLQEALNDAQALLEEESLKLAQIEELDSEKLLDRISALSDLLHRYGSIESALSNLAEKSAKLQEINEFSTNKEGLLKKLQELDLSLKDDCKNLNIQRQNHLKAFQDELQELCLALKLSKPQVSLLKVEMNQTGDVICGISLNGSEIQTLSAGEFNRLRLAMMCVASRISKKQGVLILDEIDANLSGEESEGVAKVLKELSKSYQIFAISHQPHMPALADYHFLVSKANNQSHVKLLDKEGRIQEMARMISGANITQEALDFARKRLSEYVES